MYCSEHLKFLPLILLQVARGATVGQAATPTGPITNGPSSTLSSSCPSDAPKTDGDNPLCCQDKGCQGDSNTRTCAIGNYPGCPCLNLVSYPPADEYDTDLGNAQLSLFETIFAMSAAPSTNPNTPTTTASPPAYVTGTCSFHLTETQDCQPDSKNLFAVIGLKDGAGNDIGDTSVNPSTDPIGEGINDGSSYSFNSKLPNPLIVTGEHENDYIQFQYGGLNWQSKTPNGGARCNNGGWDPRDGPICNLRSGNQNAVNNMDCFFPC